MNAILRVSDKIINSDCRVESILENTIGGLDEAALDGLLLKDSYIRQIGTLGLDIQNGLPGERLKHIK